MNAVLKHEEITLERVWFDYQQSRRLRPTTLRNYHQRLHGYLSDWLKLPLRELTKEMVEARYVSIQGDAMANSTFRTLRALINYATQKYEDSDGEALIKKNPVGRLTEVRAWRRDRRRKTVIYPDQFPAFFKGVEALDNALMRDYLLLLLFTGLRRSEALNLTWNDIDLDARIITLPTTKNGEEHFVLPISDYVWKLLAIRKIEATTRFVFPGKSKERPFTAGWTCFAEARKVSGLYFSLHCLRRSWVTVADEVGLPAGTIKRLINHRLDVTEGYVIRSTERLREASQMVTDRIVLMAGIVARTETQYKDLQNAEIQTEQD